MKKKIILGAASAAVILSSLTACGNKDQSSTVSSQSSKITESTTPSSSKTSSTASSSSSSTSSSSSSSASSQYAAIAKPEFVQTLDEDSTTFGWFPVSGAAGYVAKIDDGKAIEIGNNTASLDEGEFVVYTPSTESLSDGEHTIRFATVSKTGVQSEWTDALTFTVSNVEVVTAPGTPTVDSNLKVTVSSGKFDKVTFDFGDGITAESSFANATTEHTFNVNDLGIASKLTDGEVYFVRCTVSYKGEVSKVSAPVTYKYEVQSDKETKAKAPTYSKNEFTFAEEPSAITVKINGEEYKVSNVTLTEKKISFDALVEACGIEGDDALALVDAKVSVKVNYDKNHYLASDYSTEATVTYLGDVATESKNLFNAVTAEYDSASNKYVFSVKDGAVGTKFLTVKAYDENGSELTVTAGSSLKEFATVDATGVKSITYKLVYKRNGKTETKEVKDSVAGEVTIEGLTVKVENNRSIITWNHIASVTDYLIEITSGSTTKKYYANKITDIPEETATTGTDTTETVSVLAGMFDVTGEFSLKVYGIDSNNKVMEYSVSDTLSLNKLDTPNDFTVTKKTDNHYVTVGKDMIVLTQSTKDGSVTTHTEEGEEVSIDKLYSIEVYRLGNGYNAVDSSSKYYVFTKKNDTKYHFEDNQYIVLDVDYITFKDVLGKDEQAYLSTDGNKFDFMSYMFKTNKTEISLTSGDSTTLVSNTLTYDNGTATKENFSVNSTISWNDKINTYTVKFGTLTTDAAETSKKSFTISAQDSGNKDVANCKFELEVIQIVTSKDSNGKEVKTEVIKSKSTVNAGNFYMDSITEKGTYVIRVRVAGNGAYLAGMKSDKELTLSESGWTETSTYVNTKTNAQ